MNALVVVDNRPNGDLFAHEVWCLSRSLQIASVLGDAPPAAALAADRIGRAVGDGCCVSLSNAPAWTEAVQWAVNQQTIDPRCENGRWSDRQQLVGEACGRLRQKGYRVSVGAYGPEVATRSSAELFHAVDSLVARIGGVNTIAQVYRMLDDGRRIHDGIWLFGDQVPGLYQRKSPAVPYGWLLSLGLKHVARQGDARKPEVAWKTLIGLTIDYAASLDCQRYSEFENLSLHPSGFHRALRDSLIWREVFSYPQVPPRAAVSIGAVLRDLLTAEDNAKLGVSFAALLCEMEETLSFSVDDRATLLDRRVVERRLPLLWTLARGISGKTNSDYIDPMKGGQRTSDASILFETGRQVLTLPRAMVASAACETMFRLLWGKLDRKRAEKITGATIEKAMANACIGKSPIVLAAKTYLIGKQKFEIDAATRDGDKIVHLESKSKSLTANARSGDLLAFFSDYADSFLAMLEQLSRHESHFRAGLSPLSREGDDVESIRPIKVAVSPLSYGPLSDKALTGSVILALANVTFYPKAEAGETGKKSVDKFNAAMRETVAELAKVAPRKDDQIDLRGYLIDVFWLDLGQVLYVLDRSNTAWDAFAPLKHITFSTRDFWSEIASADRNGMTKDRWRPV